MKAWVLAAISIATIGSASAKPSVVAAENVYGDIVSQLSGDHASVTSILNNPDEDPHLFEASVTVGKSLAAAKIVVVNGAGYDPWMRGLLDATNAPNRKIIDVAALVGAHDGDNPHLWYRLDAIRAVANAITEALIANDPANVADYRVRLSAFENALRPVDMRIASLHGLYAGLPVTATEPVFGYMASAIGLKMRNEAFQLAVMNNTEPSVSQTEAMSADLRGRQVRVLIYNSQATDTAAKRLLDIAHQAQIPVVGVTETEPKGLDYQHWMLEQLAALQTALKTIPQTTPQKTP